MAIACQMSERKLKDCLAFLRAAHLVKQSKRTGLTDVYELLPEMVALWKEYLDQRLSTGEFEASVKLVLLESRFFPTAKELVEAVRGDAEANALHEWELCVRAAARVDRAVLIELSPQGQSALHLVGGLYKLGMSTKEQLSWMKKEFIAVWKSILSDTNALPTARTTQLASH